MNLIRKIKVKLSRRIRRINELPDHNGSPNYLTASAIFRLALRDSEVDLLLAPVKGKRIIKSEKRGIYITLEKTNLDVVNHSFAFSLNIPQEAFVKLSRLFDKRLDSLVEKDVQQMVKQVNEGLSKVLETFKNNS